MQLVVNEFGAVLLEDRDTFTDFAVRAPADYEIVRVGKALEAAWVGEAVDGHAWISAAAVARLADADGAGDDWRTGEHWACTWRVAVCTPDGTAARRMYGLRGSIRPGPFCC